MWNHKEKISEDSRKKTCPSTFLFKIQNLRVNLMFTAFDAVVISYRPKAMPYLAYVTINSH